MTGGQSHRGRTHRLRGVAGDFGTQQEAAARQLEFHQLQILEPAGRRVALPSDPRRWARITGSSSAIPNVASAGAVPFTIVEACRRLIIGAIHNAYDVYEFPILISSRGCFVGR